MDIFSYQAEKNKEKMAPLAARMRPRSLEEVVGQEHILGKDKLLSAAFSSFFRASRNGKDFFGKGNCQQQ